MDEFECDNRIFRLIIFHRRKIQLCLLQCVISSYCVKIPGEVDTEVINIVGKEYIFCTLDYLVLAKIVKGLKLKCKVKGK